MKVKRGFNDSVPDYTINSKEPIKYKEYIIQWECVLIHHTSISRCEKDKNCEHFGKIRFFIRGGKINGMISDSIYGTYALDYKKDYDKQIEEIILNQFSFIDIDEYIKIKKIH